MGSIHAGDIMLYGASCLVLFYEDFNTSYRYTPLGYIEDPDGLAKGKKVSLKASISPQKASDKNLIWTSSNKKVAAVSKNGVVTGKKKGTAVITAFATDGSAAIRLKIR